MPIRCNAFPLTPRGFSQYRQLHTTFIRSSQPINHGQNHPSIPPPLAGLRIVDLTRVLAGPYCTMLLADLGADVIKVENPVSGDDTRSWSPPNAPLLQTKDLSKEILQTLSERKKKYWDSLPAESAYFLSVNRNKRSITVDLKKPEGKKIVEELIKSADVVVENYLPGKLAKMGLGYEDAKRLNPSIVYASITGYGQTGPYSSAAGYDVIIAADAGMFHITGEADRPPVKIGVAMTDLTTGLYVHGAIMAALLGRGKTGQGVHIDASLFESQIASLVNVASSYLVAGKEAKRWGTAHPSIVPYQVFATQDNFLMVGAGNDGQFRKLTKALGEPALADDERYATNAQRVANRDELIDKLSALFSHKSTKQWCDEISKLGIPIAPIRNIQETFEHPQAVGRDVVCEVDHPRAGKIKINSPAVRYGEGKMQVLRPPPVLGQHTEEVLGELGYDESKIDQLREQGAIGQ
ncbi:CAIB BAIF family enzyme [Meira miltonrushii]|uniref:CAIB BAIF family enzyme n=1 Tax=Meira miltonrushii TaxID=1280837 RepID=A0A316VL37_9BASI|nr:CAIB BAIF family enzyme [Meira miltonrushii]PWN38339.1 CAIB BAIF family enzyme [Meira miltonrushii]